MSLLDRLQSRGAQLSAVAPRLLIPEKARPAAVVAPLILPNWSSSEDEASLLYIKRSENLTKHAGQMAFPGGARDEQDETLLDAGLREGEEEVGLKPEGTRLLATLPQAFTPSGFFLQPFFVATVQSNFVAQESEVASIHKISLQELRSCPVRLEYREWEGQEYRVIFFDTETVCIWGVTGRITEVLLTQFFDWSPPDAKS